MNESQKKSDSPQDTPMEQGQQPMEIEQQQPPMVHERKRGKQFWTLMTLFSAAVIIGFVVMVLQSGNSESPVASLSGNGRQNEPSRIIGGSPSYENKFPYYVDTGNCGGVLIAPKVVLSAAHCGFKSYGNKGNRVVVNGSGRAQIGANGKVRTWSRWVVHPGYNSNKMLINDFALYMLDQPVTGLPVGLSLNNNPSFPAAGTPVTAIGTGQQNIGPQGAQGQLFLHDVVIPVVNAEECKNKWGSSVFNTNVMMCAGATGKGICYGDSGGPLVVRNGNRDILVGITSFLRNKECGKFNKYDNVFARTSGAFNWIKSVVCDQWGEQADFCTGNPTCSDKAGWTDRDGYNCAAYAATEATDLRICEYHKNIPGADGLSPVQACCVCNYVKGQSSTPDIFKPTNPAPTPGGCSDSPGWTDPNGYNCASYAVTEDQGTPVCVYHKDIPGVRGLTPVQACCVCNYVSGQTSTTPGSCSDSPGWTDPNGYGCSSYELTEAQGTPVCEYHRDIPGTGGLTPVQACCVCK